MNWYVLVPIQATSLLKLNHWPFDNCLDPKTLIAAVDEIVSMVLDDLIPDEPNYIMAGMAPTFRLRELEVIQVPVLEQIGGKWYRETLDTLKWIDDLLLVEADTFEKKFT